MVEHYYVDKTSDTSADTLLAIGFARLLSLIIGTSKGIVLRDAGPYNEVLLPTSLTASQLQQVRPLTPIRPLYTDKQAKNDKAVAGFDYQQQQEISKAYYEKLKRLPAELRTPEARARKHLYPALSEISEPAPELGHYQAINRMRIASSFNDLIARWNELDTLQSELVHLLLTLFRQPGNDIEAAMVRWQKLMNEHKIKTKALVSELQIVNPTAGKGSRRPKASSLLEGNPDNFWPLELLKFVGFLAAAAPYTIQGSKDRKTYVLQPNMIELSTLQHIMHTFRAVCWSSTAIKLDVLASLRFAQVFIMLREQALKGEASKDEDDFLDEEQIYSLAHGFEVAFYKDMGSAYATMNVASLSLPQWLPSVKTLEATASAQALLNEHLTIILQLRNSKGEEGSEEYELLRHYRNFLSGRDLLPFWQFTTAYSSYLISQREREKNPRRWIRSFTVNGLEKLLAMSTTASQKHYSTITANSGFQRIAYAIRQATVRAQYRRSQLRDRTYEVHYGLGRELKREARYPEKFIAVLSDFLHQYNEETAREEEKLANKLGRPLTAADRRAFMLRGAVSYADIDQIIALMDAFSSEMVGSLLVAYGYASDPRKEPRNDSSDGEEASSDEVALDAVLLANPTNSEE